MALSIGTVINNRYRIAKLIAQGGFGAVYRAWDLNLQSPVALKENLTTSPEAIRQFALEARMVANLRQENLPYVIDHFTIEGQGQYLVMEFVDGQDLQDKLDQAGGPLPAAQVIPWMVQVCNAVSYLHSQTQPIIHRDIKPANIKITPKGKVMLVDFGIAKVFDPARKTTIGARAVTQGFSPPEQYGEGLTEVRSDVYALGATLYALLTGQTPVDSLLRRMGTSLQAPRQINPVISPHLEQVILRATELDLERRFQSVAALKNALLADASAQASAGGVKKPQEPAEYFRPESMPGEPTYAAAPTPQSYQPQAYAPQPQPPLYTPTVQAPAAPGYPPAYAGRGAAPPPQAASQRSRGLGGMGLALFLAACLVLAILGGGGLYLAGLIPGWQTPTATERVISQALESTSTALEATVRARSSEIPATAPSNVPPTAPPTWTSPPPVIQPPTDTPSPAPSLTPTWTPSPVPTDTQNPKATWQPCPAGYPSRLHVGDKAYISYDPPLPNRVRSQPGTDGVILGYLDVGEQMEIIGGPVCINNWIWWRVKSLAKDLTGWTAEGDEKAYWLVPMP
ncbi:MAG: protein kinase [Anaerolineales bacterium]|nr:protein kinase [Anaerolineales bacterium]